MRGRPLAGRPRGLHRLWLWLCTLPRMRYHRRTSGIAVSFPLALRSLTPARLQRSAAWAPSTACMDLAACASDATAPRAWWAGLAQWWSVVNVQNTHDDGFGPRGASKADRATLQRSLTAERAFCSVLAALVTRVDGAYMLACARGRWCSGADATVLRGQNWTGTASGPVAGRHGRAERHCSAR